MDKQTKKPEARDLGDDLFGRTAAAEVLVEIALTDLKPNPYQPRKSFDSSSIAELASSIEIDGQLQPIAVVKDVDNDGLYIIVLGERRFRAVKHLKRKTIKARVLPQDSDLQKLALIENLQREDLHPLEEAEGLQALMEAHDVKQGELGKLVGKARQTVSESLKLTTLPDDVKKDWRQQSKPAPKSVMLELTRVPDAAKQLSLWDAIKAGNVTVRSARDEKKGHHTITTPVPSPAARAITAGHSFAARLVALDSRNVRAKKHRKGVTRPSGAAQRSLETATRLG